ELHWTAVRPRLRARAADPVELPRPPPAASSTHPRAASDRAPSTTRVDSTPFRRRIRPAPVDHPPPASPKRPHAGPG
ncbi:MAG: hypothetical protein ABI251_03655, partial [Mycobacteriaceae bacterium]